MKRLGATMFPATRAFIDAVSAAAAELGVDAGHPGANAFTKRREAALDELREADTAARDIVRLVAPEILAQEN